MSNDRKSWRIQSPTTRKRKVTHQKPCGGWAWVLDDEPHETSREELPPSREHSIDQQTQTRQFSRGGWYLD